MLFYKMADILSPVKINSAEIGIMDYTNRKMGFYESISGLNNERYAFLKVNGRLVMSETPMEHRTNSNIVIRAYGDVLIGGLGIGMIILPIQERETVSSVTVLEKNEDVIACVADQLPLNDKVRIICADAYEWKPDRKFDCIYMDIWGDISEDDYDDMKRLKKKIRSFAENKGRKPPSSKLVLGRILRKNWSQIDINLIKPQIPIPPGRSDPIESSHLRHQQRYAVPILRPEKRRR